MNILKLTCIKQISERDTFKVGQVLYFDRTGDSKVAVRPEGPYFESKGISFLLYIVAESIAQDLPSKNMREHYQVEELEIK